MDSNQNTDAPNKHTDLCRKKYKISDKNPERTFFDTRSKNRDEYKYSLETDLAQICGIILYPANRSIGRMHTYMYDIAIAALN